MQDYKPGSGYCGLRKLVRAARDKFRSWVGLTHQNLNQNVSLRRIPHRQTKAPVHLNCTPKVGSVSNFLGSVQHHRGFPGTATY